MIVGSIANPCAHVSHVSLAAGVFCFATSEFIEKRLFGEKVEFGARLGFAESPSFNPVALEVALWVHYGNSGNAGVHSAVLFSSRFAVAQSSFAVVRSIIL